MKNRNKVIIIGAGWAGLSAAVSLADHDLEVTVLEAAPSVGGRARGILYNGKWIDNGQHLFVGAYQNTLSILERVGIKASEVFNRRPFKLHMEGCLANSTKIELTLNSLPPSLNLIIALIFAQGLSSSEKKAALRLARTLTNLQFELPNDQSIKEFLLECRQPDSLVNNLWGPLALATLSTPIEQASAQVFLKVLNDTFNQSSQDSNFLFPKTHLTQLFCDPVITYLKNHQVNILLNNRVKHLLINNGVCTGVATQNEFYPANAIILATPFEVTAQLLLPHPALTPLHRMLSQLKYQPITTVYLYFSEPITLLYPLMGIIQGTAHWVFNRSTPSEPNLLSVIISGSGEHSLLDHETLVKTILQELSTLIPNLHSLQSYKVICEKRAAFSCDVGVNQFRPTAATIIQGLFLAGDYTKTEYPSTLEGAVKSGIRAADLTMLELAKEHFFTEHKT